ncbi:uncharacterized protein LOC119734306 isoform X1 [Patiria miniata]|uniref:Uncharacterized protein n=1 Tax=Patiria miniata TaxID=46514 RepID=A0A914AJS0_PATMI|nr:uncharacterized protein LOC119734306 isoform X1 [Patiria miniata]
MMTVEDGWSKCDVLCGIGYQSRRTAEQEESTEIRRCLGIDCDNPEQLEASIACSHGGATLLILGILLGMVLVLAAYGFKIHLLPRIKKATEKKSGSKRKAKASKRPPATVPRSDKTKGGGDEEEHLYEEIDEIQSKKTKASNRYVTMTSKPKKEKKQSNKKQEETDDESEDGYLEPDEINQPGSEELEIEKLREAPPPPGKTSNSKIDKGAPSHNEYEIPTQNDYLEIE